MADTDRVQNLLVPYDPSWASAFEAERQRLAPALSGIARAIEHFGSTAVPGMTAKPILDLLVGLDRLDDWGRCRVPLERLDYEHFATAGVAGHEVFVRGRSAAERTHLLHLVAIDSPHWRLNLAFRDRLRADPALRTRYEAIKQRAAAEAPTDRVAYNALKSGFIGAVMAEL